ncbi:MAG: asparagine synthase (glutamine-hydrolyzing) [Dehalococcoidales bacterium]|nr:asparagine synthase (glutamine-hydrolyzing) [Dehalococcoidales bacterium]
MCGINGFNWANKELLSRMNYATRFRGPDGEGEYIDSHVSLGHRRLSIIDLSANGSQPMCNEDETVWLTYNGEIYNYTELRKTLEKAGHTFKSNTDSEVIIHAYEEYGTGFENKLNGMWAFCIYDAKNMKMLLSRDRFGIKPLYYYLNNDQLIFSSMIAGIMCHDIPTHPNEPVIMEYLAHNLLHHTEQTFFINISSLKPGSSLVFDLSKKTTQKYHWYSPTPGSNIDKSQIRNLFLKSVESMTQSDVPVGSCLSGGMDSSSIVMTLDKLLNYKVNTFSYVAPGQYFDESKYIIEIGKHTDTTQFFTQIHAEEFLEDIMDFITNQEEPVTGVSPYAGYRVMKLAHTSGAKVLLDGQGGDEIFAGYTYYFGYYFKELFTQKKWIKLLIEILSYLKNAKSVYSIGLFGFIMMPKSIRFFLWTRFVNRWVNHKLLREIGRYYEDPRWDVSNLKSCLSLTLFETAIPHLLMWEDKNAMRWSIESRVPFLDTYLVEAAMGLSPDQLLTKGRTKLIFRDSVKDIVPPLIRNRTDKIGFKATSDDIFRNEKVAHFVQQVFLSDRFKKRPYWKHKTVMKMLSDHITGKRNCGDTIWKILNIELWLQHYFE